MLLSTPLEKLPVFGLAAALLLYSLAKLAKQRRLNKFKEIPEHPSKLPYLGHLLALGKSPGVTIAQWHNELGPILRVRVGAKRWISISDPVLAYKVFVRHGGYTSYRPYTTFTYKYYSHHGRGITFSNPGEGHKENKAAVMAVLGQAQLEKHHELLANEADVLVRMLMEDTAANGSTHPTPLLRLSTLNVIMLLGVGKRYATVTDPEFVQLEARIKESLHHLHPSKDIGGFLPALFFIDYLFGHRKSMEHHAREAELWMRKLIKEAYLQPTPNFAQYVKQEHPELTETDTIVLLSTTAPYVDLICNLSS